jgi:hypothetical protein
MNNKRTATLLAVLLCCLILASVVLGQGSFDLSWWTADGGGSVSSGGGYTLSGTMGQPDAGVLAGGGYTLFSGFWGGLLARYGSYLPLIMRNWR